MKHKIVCRETGECIDYFPTLEEAKNKLLEYETEDKKNGEYLENFYDVITKEIYDIIKELELKYKLNDINIDEDTLSKCETIEEVIEYIRGLDDNGEVTQAEVMYFGSAMQYLAETDPSLMISLGVASDYGIPIEKLNSEMLASILKTEKNKEEFAYFLAELELELTD